MPWVARLNQRFRSKGTHAGPYLPHSRGYPGRYQRYRPSGQPRTGWKALLYATARWPRRWVTGPRLLWLAGIVVSVGVLWLAGSHLGPALRAADGQGTVGLWTAQRQDSGQWYGEFVSSTGAVTLPGVYYAGSLSGVQPGTTVPALDAGASDEVYPLTGSAKWIHDLIGVVVGGLALIALLARGLVVTRRRRRAVRSEWFSFDQ